MNGHTFTRYEVPVMVNPLHTDDDTAVDWCPHCREYHKGESREAIQDMIQNMCAEGE